MGDDLAIVRAAQVSFDKASDVYGEREAAILAFLMREEHGVPFESVVFKFRLRLPLFLAAQFKKHRISSWSEQSARYDEMAPHFYEPAVEDVRKQVGSPGRYTYEPVAADVARAYRESLKRANEASWLAYRTALSMGVSREQARLSLPVNLYTTVVWTINARSLFNVIHLRADSHAQLEAQRYAVALEVLAETVIPDTISRFRAAGRPKP